MSPVVKVPFRDALRDVWSEPRARQFTVFVFVSMLAYSAQDLILEPFAGTLFGYYAGPIDATVGNAERRRVARHDPRGLSQAAQRSPGDGDRCALWAIGGCVASAVSLLRLCARCFSRTAVAARRVGVCARRFERCVRGSCNRFDDGAGRRRSCATRRCAHGRVGRGAGCCVWSRWLPRYRRDRCYASADRFRPVLRMRRCSPAKGCCFSSPVYWHRISIT